MNRNSGAILLCFVALVVAVYWNAPGDDISSTYIACLLIAEGIPEAIYAHHPTFFHVVDDPRWTLAAERSGFAGFLHPYVQIPAWAQFLQPLCSNMSFPWFGRLFTLLSAASVAGVVFLASKHWAPMFLRPLPLVALLAVIWVSVPFKYAMYLTQNHPQILFLSIASIVIASRRPAAAGGLLALAAAIKLTPAFVGIYWIAKGNYRAAGWAFAWALGLCIASVIYSGIGLSASFVAEIDRISGVLLVAYNNQSLASWLGGWVYPNYIFSWEMMPLAPSIKILSMAMLILCCAFGGWMDRNAPSWAGALFVLVVITALTPIAWTHYYLALIPGAMLLAQQAGRSRASWGLILAAALLNMPPLALVQTLPVFTPVTLTRSTFYSGLLIMAGLMVIWRRARTEEQSQPCISPPRRTQTRL